LSAAEAAMVRPKAKRVGFVLIVLPIMILPSKNPRLAAGGFRIRFPND